MSETEDEALKKKKTNYMLEFANELEALKEEKCKEERIRILDYSLTVPKSLRTRVSQIIPYDYYDFDETAFVDKSLLARPECKETFETQKDEDFKKKPKEYTESTCSEIMKLEGNFKKFDLKLPPPPESLRKQKKKFNWFTTYLKQQRRDRVKWNTKIYDMETRVENLPPELQAEVMMNASAEKFTKWINGIGGKVDIMTEEKIKILFAIEAERFFLQSIQVQPQEVRTISKTVAESWNLPEMAVETNYMQYIEDRKNYRPGVFPRVAFGRTIPVTKLPWVQHKKDIPMKTFFTDQLMSLEVVFKGITHLSTIKSLVKFYKKRPHLEVPAYLITSGAFDEVEEVKIRTGKPLYDILRLKY